MPWYKTVVMKFALLPLLFFAAFATRGGAAESPAPEPQPTWPLWDGQESVEAYAQRASLPPTKTLDLGSGVKLELVLIPAGRFIMGTPESVPVDEEGFHKKIVVGQALLALGGGVLLVLLGAVAVQAFRKRQHPKFSLARLLAMTVAAGLAVLSGLHWWHSAKKLEEAKTEYLIVKARYDDAYAQEKPAHLIIHTRPFYMGKFEVTQEQYQQVMGTNPSEFRGPGNPVDGVSWANAQGYCSKLTEETKQLIRLPTEAEWEYGCRAGTKSTYYSGDNEADLERVAWYSSNSNRRTHPVGQKEPNAFGLYDMHGNVLEWCQDWYADDYYGKSPREDPPGPIIGSKRVFRGSSWGDEFKFSRSADRAGYSPEVIFPIPSSSTRGLNFGFRVATPAMKSP
ncbi:MAG: SUMF1/EgtB/PvdO family nonheme iron enzyme [Planctomycetes bacterium]|nr:SUMF1/EgtB/PvdO family nonheme iron enzyme [Planctomycetota bacterium]